MVVKPPCDLWRRGVLEIDDRIFVARKIALIEERTGTVHQSVILIADLGTDPGSDALSIKPCKQRS
jgi:hypothetical protein